MFFAKFLSLRRPTVIVTTASIAFTTLLGVSIILMDLESELWGKVLMSSGIISVACTGILSSMSALSFPRVRYVSTFGIVCCLIALPLALLMVWSPDAPDVDRQTYTAILWAYLCAQVSLLFSVGNHNRRGWTRWLTISATFSVLTAALLTPEIWNQQWFTNEFMYRIRISLFCLAAAGGIILPALARLMPPAKTTTTMLRHIHPVVVLTTAQSASIRQRAAAEGLTEQQLLDRLLGPADRSK